MDAQQALADLTEISSQIQAAVVFDDRGKVAGSTLENEARAADFARSAAELLGQADPIRTGEAALTQLEVSTEEGSVFVVLDRALRIAATTGRDPTVGLVFYDLKSALRQLAAKPAAKRSVRAKGPVKKAQVEPGEGSTGEQEVRKRAPTKGRASKNPTEAKKPATTRKRTTPRKKPDAP